MHIIKTLLKSILLISTITLTACNSKTEAPIKIVANSWIGYSPLFYAKDKGWLDEINIEVSNVVSLGESMMIYQTGHFQAITGTQYEYQKLREKHSDLIPIIMFDRSNGGDMVMSNQSIIDLQNTSETIDVFLEIDSINYLVFKDFIKAHQLSDKNFNYINKDQLRIITQLKTEQASQPTIIVTYVPYNFELANYGFETIASTKDIKGIIVLDALYTSKQFFMENKETFKQLKVQINRALKDLKQDPKVYYTAVKPYLEDVSYQDFKAALNDIEWLNETPTDEIVKKMNSIDFPSRDLL
ncbi:MAG: hypothetical protein U9N57_10160 [Pseudomonadota bacterium]|nr:hypothetical protein [Pseudomonadota bacterium]